MSTERRATRVNPPCPIVIFYLLVFAMSVGESLISVGELPEQQERVPKPGGQLMLQLPIQGNREVLWS
jgi:hypothetical protein